MTDNAEFEAACGDDGHVAHEHNPKPDWVIERAVAMFKAMGDPARLRLWRFYSMDATVSLN